MLVEMLAGRHPFEGRKLATIPGSILHEPVHLPGDSAEARALDAVLQRCVAKDAALRFASIAELRPLLLFALRRCPALPAAAGGNVIGPTPAGEGVRPGPTERLDQ
jgi:serine/threonine protein kinase